MTHISKVRRWMFDSLLYVRTLSVSLSLSPSSSLKFSGFWSANCIYRFPLSSFFSSFINWASNPNSQSASTILWIWPCHSPTQRVEMPSNTRFHLSDFFSMFLNNPIGVGLILCSCLFMSKTQSIHFKHCDVYVVVTTSPERCSEHISYIHISWILC